MPRNNKNVWILTLKYELYTLFQCMHCKPTPGNTFKNKNKLPNFECTLRVKKQWEQMHYLIIKNTLDPVHGWGGSSGSQRQVKWGLLGGAASGAGAELSLSSASAGGGPTAGEDRQLSIRTSYHFVRNSKKKEKMVGNFMLTKNNAVVQNWGERPLKALATHTLLWLHDKILILFNSVLLAATSLLQSLCFSFILIKSKVHFLPGRHTLCSHYLDSKLTVTFKKCSQ